MTRTFLVVVLAVGIVGCGQNVTSPTSGSAATGTVSGTSTTLQSQYGALISSLPVSMMDSNVVVASDAALQACANYLPTTSELTLNNWSTLQSCLANNAPVDTMPVMCRAVNYPVR